MFMSNMNGIMGPKPKIEILSPILCLYFVLFGIREIRELLKIQFHNFKILESTC